MLAWLILALSTQGQSLDPLERAKQIALAAGFSTEEARFDGFITDRSGANYTRYVGKGWSLDFRRSNDRLHRFRGSARRDQMWISEREKLNFVVQFVRTSGFSDIVVLPTNDRTKFSLVQFEQGFPSLNRGSVEVDLNYVGLLSAWFPEEFPPRLPPNSFPRITPTEAEHAALSQAYKLFDLPPMRFGSVRFGVKSPKVQEFGPTVMIVNSEVRYFQRPTADDLWAAENGFGVLQFEFTYIYPGYKDPTTVINVSADTGQVVSVTSERGSDTAGIGDATSILTKDGWRGFHRALVPLKVKYTKLREERIVLKCGDWIVAGSLSVDGKVFAMRLLDGYRYFENPGIPEELTR